MSPAPHTPAASVPPVTDDARWLHDGGRAGAWGSLGLWAADTPDYFGACAALAGAVAGAAGLRRGERVLSVACGAGEELRCWAEDFGAAEVVGVELDAALVAAARHRVPQARVIEASGTALEATGLPAASFDRVLCVDAAYHLHPREAFLRGALQRLRPGGRLAFTDLVAPQRRGALALAARLCGVPPDGLLSAEAQQARLHALGFADVRCERLDDAVLGGFARFVHARRVAPWRWPRVAATAALIGPCRAAGLGYAMLSASRPART
ncbi:MAG: class I SAM-dependent methyltransferase [Rubrivivax sp.]|nr:class I SAM-dependent methyltransferase [Rubrivivax sp.]